MSQSNEFVRVRRSALVTALGGKCSCKGVDCWHTGDCSVTDSRCLQIDHINGDGAADRKRVSSVGLAYYYFKHISEAREKLQILCANCNWVKRQNNSEVRNGDAVRERRLAESDSDDGVSHEAALELATVELRLTESASYARLLESFHRCTKLAISLAAFDLFDDLERWGLSEGGNYALSHYLVRYWKKQRFYGGSVPELDRFIREKELVVRSSLDILEKRRLAREREDRGVQGLHKA